MRVIIVGTVKSPLKNPSGFPKGLKRNLLQRRMSMNSFKRLILNENVRLCTGMAIGAVGVVSLDISTLSETDKKDYSPFRYIVISLFGGIVGGVIGVCPGILAPVALASPVYLYHKYR